MNAIHFNSARAKGPLVKVNCTSIPDTLLESELFGHEKGAFYKMRHVLHGALPAGLRKQAAVPCFSTRLGARPPPLQSKPLVVLRAVQERTVERLGSNIPVAVDIRLITATSRNLEEAVQEGEFREDLYYRLNVVTVPLPPLRERRQDIPALIEHFLHRRGRAASITPESSHDSQRIPLARKRSRTGEHDRTRSGTRA